MAMNTLHGRVRVAAIGAPVLLFLYGVLRLIDGMDGHRGPGFAWNLGHTLFLIAFLLFGSLVVGLRQLVAVPGRPARVVASLATAAGLFGAACFVWGILGDLFARVHDTAPVPGPLAAAGPLVFQVGILGLLVMLVAARPRRLPFWTPLLVLGGFLLFAIDLDLIPVGALIVLCGLSPLARRSPVRSTPAVR
ncbi:MAG: hypothetical protein J2P15_05385 [Micromonosporaceae bacterium]|nr:hypothetical protein [Micromonosporaceae bacterium]